MRTPSTAWRTYAHGLKQDFHPTYDLASPGVYFFGRA
jgi:hypothetical protein